MYFDLSYLHADRANKNLPDGNASWTYGMRVTCR